jgi:4-amino-4-deoxy-L-arabinose transferase-like glycosyltransferase
MALFGTHDWAVRLVPVMASFLALSVAAAWTTRLRGPRAGATTLFVLGTTGGFLLMARVALTDALLMACLTAAWLWAYLALAEQRRGWWRASLVALALALLAKGFVALALFGLVGVVHLLVNERARWRQHLRLIADPAAWGLFLLVAAPWHIAASLELREFAWFYFINEHVLRFLGLREPKDYYHGTIFYYLPRLALMALPWWPVALLAAWRRRAKGVVEAAGDSVKPFVVSLSNHASPSTSSEPAPDLIGGRTDVQSPERFLWVCALAPLTFFSVSSAKANYYIVVCLPPLALLAAWQIDAWRRQPHRGRDAFIATCGSPWCRGCWRCCITVPRRKASSAPAPWRPPLPPSPRSCRSSSIRITRITPACPSTCTATALASSINKAPTCASASRYPTMRRATRAEPSSSPAANPPGW